LNSGLAQWDAYNDTRQNQNGDNDRARFHQNDLLRIFVKSAASFSALTPAAF
jgi:hypothetical protein